MLMTKIGNTHSSLLVLLRPKEHERLVALLPLVLPLLVLLRLLLLFSRALALSSLDGHCGGQGCAETDALVVVEGGCCVVNWLFVVLLRGVFSLPLLYRVFLFGKQAI